MISDPSATVLFICLGNICRSQMAEGWYNHYTNSHNGTSAGTNPLIAHQFNHPANEAIEVMKEEGIDISRQTAKAVTQEMVQKADKVIVFCQPDECPDYISNNPKTHHHFVEDPFAKNIDEFRSVREQIRLIIQDYI